MKLREPEWAHMAATETTRPTDYTSSTGYVSLSPILNQKIQTPQAEYDKFLQFLLSQRSGQTATHTSTSSMGSFLASSDSLKY